MGKPAVASSYSPAEEVANTVTHGVGVVLSIAGLALLVSLAALRGDVWHITSVAIFGVTLVVAYSTSTIYHALRSERAKRIMRKFDHAAIFLLIAGTYTPFALVSLRGAWGWSLFGVVWGLCGVGIILKFFLAGKFRVLSTLIYVLTGWLIVVAIRPLAQNVPSGGVWLLIAGGVCYTGGTAFYLWKSLRFHHAIWHLFVLAGSVCHFFSVLRYVVPSAS